MVFNFLDKVSKKVHSTAASEPKLLQDSSIRKVSPKSVAEGAELYDCHEEGVHSNEPPREGEQLMDIPQKTDLDDLRKFKERKSQAIGDFIYAIIGVLVLSFFMGSLGVSYVWLLLLLVFTWTLVKGNLKRVVEDVVRFESLRLHRRRALQADETCEWLNLILNRWWVFSSSTIFNNLKRTLDPILNEAKPSIVEAISLKEVTLGDKTPLLRSVRSWDVMSAGSRDLGYQSSCSLHTPSGLDRAPTHTLALLCDLVLDSEAFSAVLSARVGHKGMGVDLDIAVEHLVLEGRVLVTLYLDMESPFPHISRLALSFTERPMLSFRVKMLKSVQMMEVPLLKTWIHNLVTDALETAWVDPGRLTINVNSSEGFVPDQRPGDSLAHGVLTVTLKVQKGSSSGGIGGDEDKWVVISTGGNAHITPPLRSPHWHDTSSFLLPQPPSSSNVVVKVKSKKLITTTLTQYDIPLQQYNLEITKITESLLHKKGVKVMGGNVPPLHMRLEYTPLTPVNLEQSLPPALRDVGNGCGVLYIVVHEADNLVTDVRSPNPYCLVFNSRKKVKTTHFVSGSTCPRWECGVEVLVPDIAAVCLTFLICSLPKNPKFQDGDLIGIHTLNLSTVSLPLVRKKLNLNRGISSPTTQENSNSNSSTVTVSLVFRCVTSVSVMPHQDIPHFRGMPLPVPGALSSPSGSPGLKTFLGSHEGDGSKRQNFGDILATGLGLIELTIIKASDLIARDLNGFSDPYCVVKVNGEFKYRTKVKKKTLDPIWNESFMTHLPKFGQTVSITLWDHDAFGKDFLGSVSLSEENVRRLSSEGAPVWCNLEEVKAGSLEIRIRLISEDHEFESRNRNFSKLIENEAHESDDEIDCSSSESNVSDGLKRLKDSSSNRASSMSGIPFKLKTPNKMYVRKNSQTKNNYLNGDDPKVLQRACSNPSLNKDNGHDIHSSASNSQLSTTIDPPPHTPNQRRKSGAEILFSALAIARANNSISNQSLNQIQSKSSPTTIKGNESNGVTGITAKTGEFEVESIEPFTELRRSDSTHSDMKNLPKISLNDQSEDDYGPSENSVEVPPKVPKRTYKVSLKKSHDSPSGLRAMKDKLRLFRRK